MDPILRRRLVGAAVLWAGAMVLLPWVLERKPAATEPPALVTGGDPEREMRTIDLAPPPLRETPPTPVQSPPSDAAEIPAPVAGVPAMPEPPPNEDEAASVMPERPAPPAPAARKSAPEAPVKPQAPTPVVPPKPPVSAPAAVPKPAAPPVRSDAPAAAKPAAVTPAPTPGPAPAAMAGWTVQVGSFGDLQNAQSLAARLVQRQHAAQVSTLVVDGRTLYRVRVGQLGRREDAETLRLQIEQSMGLNGKVVPTP